MPLSLPRQPDQDQVPPRALGLVRSVAAIAVLPFDRVLSGMVAAGQGIEAICLFLCLTRDLLDDSLARLGLCTPHDRPLRKPGARDWSVVDTIRLVAWRAAGVHPESIGARLGRSPNAIRSKSRRLGVPTPDREALRRVELSLLVDPEGVASVTTQNTPASALLSTTADRAPYSNTQLLQPRSKPAPVVGLRAVTPADAATAAATVGRPQREMRLFHAVTTRPAATVTVRVASIPATPIASASVRPATAPAPLTRTSIAPTLGRSLGSVIIPADPCSNIAWLAGCRHLVANETAVMAMSMRYFGGQHWKIIAIEAGLTLPAMRTILARIELPRDRVRKKFGATYDAECARATLDQSGYVLQRDASFADIETSRRPLFWRQKRDGTRLGRVTRFKRGLLDTYDKYKGQTIDLVTRADLDEPTFGFEEHASGIMATASRRDGPFAASRVTMRP